MSPLFPRFKNNAFTLTNVGCSHLLLRLWVSSISAFALAVIRDELDRQINMDTLVDSAAQRIGRLFELEDAQSWINDHWLKDRMAPWGSALERAVDHRLGEHQEVIETAVKTIIQRQLKRTRS